EVLVVSASAFLDELKRGGLAAQAKVVRSRRKWTTVALLSAMGIVAVVVPLYLWGIPGLSSLVAARIPPSWEERLGQGLLDELAPTEKICAGDPSNETLQEILDRLTSSLGQTGYNFRIVVVMNPAVNAYAVPGGTIVLFSGLLKKTANPEQLAGVLAHEVQHITKRHGTRAMLQHMSMGLIVSALSGDTRALRSAQVIGMMRYSRQYEREADEEAMKLLLVSRINRKGMVAFFESLAKQYEKSAKVPAYLSTHPDLEERVQNLKALAATRSSYPLPLLPGCDWKKVQSFCQASDSP
ncbi:MAG TPA: M48 family metallopeptidase, partial [Thermodesulfobacteriota bacterium]|nr:M48 family metallopeptidase [Thermodesulfobacteriota bacterium]